MNTIWKYVLSSVDCEVEMPNDSQVLSAQVQDGAIVVWAMVHTNTRPIKRRFQVRMTGAEISGQDRMAMRFVDTVQLNGGSIVAHVFVERDCP